MYTKKEYKTLRTVSNFISGLGWGIVGIFFFIGLLTGIGTGGFFRGIVIGALLAIAFGIPLIILGQSASVFLDQKELLELIHEALSTKDQETLEVEPKVSEAK